MSQTQFIMVRNFIDGSGTKVRRDLFLAVEGGTITAIGSLEDCPAGEGAAVDNLSHCTILPALVDCSVSLARSPSVDPEVRLSLERASEAAKEAAIEDHIRYCYEHGVLGVAEGDATDGQLKRYREKSARENTIDIRSSGPPCRSRRDYEEKNPAGSDFLKIEYSNSIEDDESPLPELTYEDLHRLIQEKGGKKAVVVANGRQRVTEALSAGADAIEQGYGMGTANLREMAEKGVLWIPGILRARNALDSAGDGGSVSCRFSQRYVAPGKTTPGAETYWKKVLAEQLTQLRLAGEMGVTAAVGTGAGSVGILHGESMVEEMKLFIKAGWSLEETVRCASANGAAFFGLEKLGRLGVGRPATFLIARGTVKQLPRKLSYLEGIYVNGAPSTSYRKDPI